ncbi:MAG: hypothetical protein ACYDG0_06310 [Vulcanimicrobiaceae bacterium]
MKARSLPLGIDIGSTRIRVAAVEVDENGVRLKAVAVRDVESGGSSEGAACGPQYLATLIDEAVAEIGVRERRCVCGLGAPYARLRTVHLPRMTAIERERAARFEARRHVEDWADPIAVRLHPLDEGRGIFALGIARGDAVAARAAAVRRSRLRLIALDHESFALGRILGDYEAIVDVGLDRSSVHAFGSGTPTTGFAPIGGAAVTLGIEEDLSLDRQTAEHRKLVLGTVGAGELARTALASEVAALLHGALRERETGSRVALVGNGARLRGLANDLESACGAIVDMPAAAVLRGEAYPDDVVAASAPEWTLAVGLALWGVRAS